MSTEERDLSPLDPERDPIRWERMVGSIMAAAGSELERRSVNKGPLLLLTDWFRPTMAASATIAAVAASAVFLVGEIQPDPDSADIRVVAEGIGIPSSLASWLDTRQADALDEYVFGYEGEVP